MSATRSRTRWLLIPVLLLGALAVLLALLLVGGWAGVSLKSASAVWPQGQGPLDMPEPALPVEPDARIRLDTLMERVPEGLDTSALGTALQGEGPPDPGLELPDELGPALEAMDALVESSGLQMESWGLTDEAPPILGVLAVARARLVRAWRYAEADRPDEALAEMLRTARLGLLLELGGGNLLSAMVGVAIGEEALGELVELVSWERPPSAAMLAAASAEIEAASLLPSGLESSILGECAGAEAMYDQMRWWSREQLFATTEPGAAAAPGEPVAPGGRECCFPFYDADRTIQLARQRCRQAAALSLAPGSQRVFPEPEILAATGPLDVGRWLDNSVGRVLLDVSTPGYGSFMARLDRVRSRRALALAWLAVLRWQRDHPDAEPPASLQELVPAYLIQVPIDPWDQAPVAYDSGAGALWTSQGAGPDGDDELRLELGMAF